MEKVKVSKEALEAVKVLDNQELITLHNSIHESWAVTAGDVVLEKSVSNQHAIVVREIEERKLEHSSTLQKEIMGVELLPFEDHLESQEAVMVTCPPCKFYGNKEEHCATSATLEAFAGVALIKGMIFTCAKFKAKEPQ